MDHLTCQSSEILPWTRGLTARQCARTSQVKANASLWVLIVAETKTSGSKPSMAYCLIHGSSSLIPHLVSWHPSFPMKDFIVVCQVPTVHSIGLTNSSTDVPSLRHIRINSTLWIFLNKLLQEFASPSTNVSEQSFVRLLCLGHHVECTGSIPQSRGCRSINY